MIAELQNIEQALSSDSKKFIKIKPLNSSKHIKRPNVDQNSIQPTYIYLSDIHSTGKSFEEYINDLADESQLLIEVRRKHGSTSKPVDEVADIHYVKKTQQQPVTMNQNAQQPVSTPQSAFNSSSQNQMMGMNYVKLQADADRSNEHYKSYLEEKEKVMKLTNEIAKKDAEIIELKTFKNTAEMKMDLVKQMAALNNKGAMDSEAVKEVVKMLPQLAPMLMGAKTGGASAAGMNAADLSQVKQAFIALIHDPRMDDDVIGLLDRVANGLFSSQEFVNELMNQLLPKYNI